MHPLLKKILRKGFTIDLEDKYAHPNDDDFVMADASVMVEAIERYCARNDEAVAFVSTASPITFILNGKETYTASLELGLDRFRRGYHVHCREVVE